MVDWRWWKKYLKHCSEKKNLIKKIMWKIDITYECYLECWKAKILQILQNWARKGKNWLGFSVDIKISEHTSRHPLGESLNEALWSPANKTIEFGDKVTQCRYALIYLYLWIFIHFLSICQVNRILWRQ